MNLAQAFAEEWLDKQLIYEKTRKRRLQKYQND
jgi:hypothetical protein